MKSMMHFLLVTVRFPSDEKLEEDSQGEAVALFCCRGVVSLNSYVDEKILYMAL